MVIGFVCPCGNSLRNVEDDVPFLADFLPQQSDDAYCAAMEATILRYEKRADKADQLIVDETTHLFRLLWQCPNCGRLLIQGPDWIVYAFLPETTSTPRNLLGAHEDDATPGDPN